MGFRLIEERPLTELERALLASAERGDPISRRHLLGILGASTCSALIINSSECQAVDLAKLWIQGLELAKRRLVKKEPIISTQTYWNKEAFRESNNVRFQVKDGEGLVVDQDLQKVTVPAGAKQIYVHDDFNARDKGGYDYESSTSVDTRTAGFKVI